MQKRRADPVSFQGMPVIFTSLIWLIYQIDHFNQMLPIYMSKCFSQRVIQIRFFDLAGHANKIIPLALSQICDLQEAFLMKPEILLLRALMLRNGSPFNQHRNRKQFSPKAKEKKITL